MSLLVEIEETIQKVLPDAEIHILDPQNDGTHLSGLVISESFVGMPLFKQHQVVMRALKGHFDASLHALQLKTFTPDEWAENKHQYQV